MGKIYKPTWTFTANTGDISSYVSRCQFRHGVNIWQNRSGYSLPKSSGRLTLSNHDDFWTEARLETLQTLTVAVDGDTIFSCRIDEYDRSAPTRDAVLALSGSGSPDYDKPVMLRPLRLRTKPIF